MYTKNTRGDVVHATSIPREARARDFGRSASVARRRPYTIPHLVLSTNIPHGERNILILHRFNVKACARRKHIPSVARKRIKITRARSRLADATHNPKRATATAISLARDAPIVGIVVTISPNFNL
jgi:hypothetical protein